MNAKAEYDWISRPRPFEVEHALSSVIAALAPYKVNNGFRTDILSSLNGEILDFISGYDTCKFERRFPRFVDWDKLPTERHAPRVILNCFLTSRGNLAFEVEPSYRTPEGYYETAPEWKIKHDFPTRREAFQRPENEVLLLRGVETLFYDLHEPNEVAERERTLACRAVAVAVWLVETRLRTHFDVEVVQAPVMRIKHDNPSQPTHLEIVDFGELRQENLREFASSSTFTEKFGVTQEVFWATAMTLANDSGYVSKDSLAKKLLRLSPEKSDIRPEECRVALERLRTASLEHLWTPPSKIRWPGLVERAFPMRLMPRSTRAGGAADLLEDKPRLSTPPVKSPYPKTNVRLPDEIAKEFGVSDVPEFVRLVNQRRQEARLPPLAQGSYPTRNSMLPSLIRYLRTTAPAMDEEGSAPAP